MSTQANICEICESLSRRINHSAVLHGVP